MKGVQCYELFGGIALKNHTFSLVCNFKSENLSYVIKIADMFATLQASGI